MRRNRVLIIFALVFATSAAVLWLGSVLAAATVEINTGITVDEGSVGNTISNTVLLATDGDMGANGATVTYTLMTTPTNGDLFLNSTLLTQTGTFLQTDIDSNVLTYDHDDSETLSDSFDFTAATSTTITSSTFLITVTAVNEPPTISGGPYSITENVANSTPVGTVITSDVDVGDTFTYSIIASDPTPAFAIGISNGEITVSDTNELDFETNPIFTVTVEIEDSGMLTDTADIVINLLDDNDPPVLSPAGPFNLVESALNTNPVGTPIVATDDDLGAGDVLTYSITSGDPTNVFDINSSGQIIVADDSQLDFETPPTTYILTIQVEDSAGATDTQVVTVNITNANEQPTVNDDSFNINENSSNATPVGTVAASDPDTSDTLTFGFSSGNSGGAFAISNDGSNNGAITVANSSQLDYETTQTFTLGIIITDSDGLQDTATVTIDINNLFDETPTANNATFFVAEGSANGVVIGTVTATDPELASGDTLAFSITGGNTGNVFAINSSSGQITVPNTSLLDADAMPTFNLTVRVIDLGGQIDTAIITVNVTPLPITNIYLPVVLNNYPPVEPNNNCSQSYGIGTGTDYEFTADDTEDWYAVTLASGGNLNVTLSSFEPAQGQLIVYGGSCSGLTVLQNDGSPSTTKTVNLTGLSAGTYYIRVFSSPITNTTYNLRVN